MGHAKPDRQSGYLWIEEGVQRKGLVAEIAPLAFGRGTYSFAVPEELNSSLEVGHRVTVPFGRSGRSVQGFVVSLDRRVWDATLRPIAGLVDAASYLTPELIDLGREIAAHYCCPLSQTLKAMTPEAVRRQRGLKTVRTARLRGPLVELLSQGHRVTVGQQALLDILSKSGTGEAVNTLLAEAEVSAAVLRGLVRRGWVQVDSEKKLPRLDEAEVELIDPGYGLNVEQRGALDKINESIDAGGFRATLLFGVSGSGKTEVYIHAIRRVLDRGQQAILLVPEIMLTTQLMNRLALRLPSLAVSHSGLTESQRSLIWQRVATGQTKVIVGTRSAVFAPCPNLGLICIDEEQETSYKNLRAPRFHVRDTAIMRCKRLGIPVVLGSATPALETWYHSQHRPDYQRVVLAKRVMELPLPTVHLVDMRDEMHDQRSSSTLSRMLVRLLDASLQNGEQALILVNRRGFANRVFCPQCRTRISCPNCSTGLVVHALRGQCLCHYCRTRIETPTTCPDVTCGAPLVQVGFGTQRVEEELHERFPDAAIRRADSDTMKHRENYQSVVDSFADRQIDILIGTQMIAKGLDFPNVSVVGVIQADIGGFAADFRAHERLFQLVTQVAGRAGRARAHGRVVVQTTTPELPALRFALTHNYEAFAADELPLRQQAGLPPYRRLARLVVADPREEKAKGGAEDLAKRINDAIQEQGTPGADILGPGPCVLPRLRGQYRFELLVRTPDAAALRKLMLHLDVSRELRTKAASLIVDVDPVSLM